ncbi:MAG TPA: ComEC/Rec2 family competence protein [Candidatus Bipolaricaulota bacterium]|nr:ComEC/Rec2 family competence protein [Candidatus Bipolaricaulota bacterium]
MFKNFSLSKKFYLSLILFIAGICLASFGADLILLVVISGLMLGVLFSSYRLAAALAIIGLVSGFYWFGRFDPPMTENFIHYYNEEKVSFSGYIAQEVDQRADHQKLTVAATELNGKKTEGLVLVKVDSYPIYEFGQKVKIECLLKKPGLIDEFDYGRYLSGKKIFSTCYNPKMQILGKVDGHYFEKYLLKAKKYLLNKINLILPEPHASFLAGLLLGARKGIPSDLTDAFTRVGVTHIIAVSGYNITVVAAALANFLKAVFIGRKKAFYFSAAGVICFVFLCGMSAAVVRAAVMGLTIMAASQLGRKTKTGHVLILAVFVMAAINPKILFFDLGFQLSFLATIGLIYISKPMEKFFSWLPQKFALRENFSTTLAAIMATMPLIMYNFNRVSLIAPLANILILSVIPLAMLCGFIGLVISIISVELGQIVSWLTWLVEQYIISAVKYLSAIGWASVDVKFGLASMLFCYAIISVFIIFYAKKLKKNNG